MTSERREQKFHTDDASLPRSGKCFWLVESNFPRGTNNQKHYPDLGSDASSVWNFCARFSGVIWRETSGSVAKCPNPPLGFTLIGAYIRLGMRILHGWNWLSCSNELNRVSKIAPTISPFVKTELRQYFSELNNPTFLTCFTNIIEPLCCRQHLLRSLKNWVHPG